MKTPSEQLEIEIEDKISHGKQWMACCTICKVSTKMKPMLTKSFYKLWIAKHFWTMP